MNRMIWPSESVDLLEHRLQALFELAPELGAGDQGAQVQGHQALVLQALGDVAVDDALGQAFHDGGLAHPGLADEHRVVLGAPGQHLDDAPDFAVPADDRVQLAVAGHLRQVLAVFLQGLELLLRGLVGDPLGTPEVRQGLEDGLGGEPLGLEQLADVGGFVRGQGLKQVLGGDVVVLHLAGLLQGLVQGFIDRRGKGRPGLRRSPSAAGSAGLPSPGGAFGDRLPISSGGARSAPPPGTGGS